MQVAIDSRGNSAPCAAGAWSAAPISLRHYTVGR